MSAEARKAAIATMPRRFLAWLVDHALPAGAAMALAAVLVMIFDPRPPIEIESLKVIPDVVHPGENAIVEIKLRVLRDCGGHLTRVLVSSAEGHPTQLYDVVDATLPPDHGTVQSVTRPFHIPYGFSRGPAIFRSKIAFHCNPFNEWWPIVVNAPDAKLIVDADAPREP